MCSTCRRCRCCMVLSASARASAAALTTPDGVTFRRISEMQTKSTTRISEMLLDPLSELTTECLFQPSVAREALTRATRDDLDSTYFESSRRIEAAIGRSEYIIAQNDSGDSDSSGVIGGSDIIGACGFQITSLTPEGRGERELATRADRQSVDVRPLLANLAVAPEWRRRGVGRQLVLECEVVASAWGFSEMLLKVEARNEEAQGLYLKLGYDVAGEAEAERPAVGLLRRGLRWERTRLVVMRKQIVSDAMRE